MTVKAATDIRKGEELFSSYTHSLWPTLVRREHLKQSKLFDCFCLRCSDPTELGTNISTLKCEDCDNGVIMSTNPVDEMAKWQCTNCKQIIPSDTVKKLFSTIQQDLDNLSSCNQSNLKHLLEEAHQKHSRKLHPQHAYLCSIKLSLIQLHTDGSDFDKKINYCEELLNVLNIIEPGYSRIRGLVLFELSVALIQSYKLRGINVNSHFDKVMAMLSECCKIFEGEARLTKEGTIGKCAKKCLIMLQGRFEEFVKSEVSIYEYILNVYEMTCFGGPCPRYPHYPKSLSN